MSYHDPYISRLDHEGWMMESVPDVIDAASDADCVVIVTDHSAYDYSVIMEAARLIVDTRNALGDAGKDNQKVIRI